MNEEDYESYEAARTESSNRVLDSAASKVIVMAGPGTGKSYLFQQLATKYRKEGKTKILVLSFINELVKDLTVDMHGLAEVCTLHSFAAKQLRQSRPSYMKLLAVIEEDLKIIEGDKKDLGRILHTMDTDERPTIEFLRNRRAYYDRLDPSISVFDLVNYYRSQPVKIPEYDLILVDEYQDFNLLEVCLINELATKSNVVIAGDDDQSLYSFKHSIPENIRDIRNGGEYEPFELPYCSRSTSVVIDAFHDVVDQAKAAGHLQGRIEKQYLYFPNPKKDKLSTLYPRISVRLGTQQQQCAYYIDREIGNVFAKEPSFTVLVICPLKSQIKKLGQALRKKGYKNVSGDEVRSEKSEELLDGIGILVEDSLSDLGWRLCANALMERVEFEGCLQQTADNTTKLKDVLPREVVRSITQLRSICNHLKNGETLSAAQQAVLFEQLEIDVNTLGVENARERLFTRSSNNVQHDIKIKITTILGSKGLSYDHVFMVNFDDRYMCGESVDDEKVNKFLVALTRSKSKVNVFTAQAEDPQFIGWIRSERKDYVG